MEVFEIVEFLTRNVFERVGLFEHISGTGDTDALFCGRLRSDSHLDSRWVVNHRVDHLKGDCNPQTIVRDGGAEYRKTRNIGIWQHCESAAVGSNWRLQCELCDLHSSDLGADRFAGCRVARRAVVANCGPCSYAARYAGYERLVCSSGSYA